MSTELAEIEKPEVHFPPGTVLQAQVVSVNHERRTLDLSRRVRFDERESHITSTVTHANLQALSGGPANVKDLRRGVVVLGRIAKREQWGTLSY